MRLGHVVLAGMLGLAAGPLRAELTPVDKQDNHANGSVLIVRGIEAGPDTIRVDLSVTTADREIELNNSGSMILVDDRGQTHRLIAPPENEEITIPANSRLTAELYFSGRLDPAAQRLVLSTNDGTGGSAENRYSGLPIFRIELPVPGREGVATPPAAVEAPPTVAAANPAETAAVPPAAPRAFPVNAQVNHPNGTVLTVEQVDAGEDGISVAIRASTAARDVQLNFGQSTQLVDDQGNVYRLVPPLDNEELRIPANSRIEGRIVFAGRLLPQAKRLTLLINERGGNSSSRSTTIPEFRIPIPIEG